MSQVNNAFRAREWANGPRKANLRLVQISASSFFAGSFFMIRGMCIAPWHNARVMFGLGFLDVVSYMRVLVFGSTRRSVLLVGDESYIVTDLSLNSCLNVPEIFK